MIHMAGKGCSGKIGLLGGEIEVVLYGMEECMASEALDEIREEGLRLQRIFSLFDPGSELSRLNAKRRLGVSAELEEVIRACLPYCELTCGAYDITHGAQFMQRKSGEEVRPSGCSYRDVSVSDGIVALEHPDAMLDLGSAAKGYIGDRLAGFIRDMGIDGFFIDLRGDLVMSGKAERILVRHPREHGKAIASFVLRDAAVATSGDYMQHYGGYGRSHIVGAKDVISATVVSGTLMEADIMATCMMVCGAGKLPLFAGARYLIVDEGMRIHGSEGFGHESA